jgi:hypothetical protein
LSVTASLGPPSINRGCGRPFEGAEHLGDLVSMCESAWEPSTHSNLIVIIRLSERAILVRLLWEIASSGTRWSCCKPVCLLLLEVATS